MFVEDECLDPNTNPCQVICKKTSEGSACSCPPGAYGDGRKDGEGCKCLQGYYGSTNVTHGCQGVWHPILECLMTNAINSYCISFKQNFLLYLWNIFASLIIKIPTSVITCVDIDECAHTASNKCQHLCINTQGSYQCSCLDGYHGDGRTDGKGCIVDSDKGGIVDSDKESPVIKIAVGNCLTLLLRNYYSFLLPVDISIAYSQLTLGCISLCSHKPASQLDDTNIGLLWPDLLILIVQSHG